MNLKSFTRSALRQREFLIRTQRSKKNVLAVSQAIVRIRQYLDFYPGATESQLKKFLIKNRESMELILPGEGSKSKIQRLEKFYELLNQSVS